MLLSMTWPEWWTWELEISPHVLKRMVDRQFTESDLRQMIDDALGLSEDNREGRFQVHTTWDNRAWIVIVEPDPDAKTLVAVTAYDVE